MAVDFPDFASQSQSAPTKLAGSPYAIPAAPSATAFQNVSLPPGTHALAWTMDNFPSAGVNNSYRIAVTGHQSGRGFVDVTIFPQDAFNPQVEYLYEKPYWVFLVDSADDTSIDISFVSTAAEPAHTAWLDAILDTQAVFVRNYPGLQFRTAIRDSSGQPIKVGQKAMAASVPVVIASDQGAIGTLGQAPWMGPTALASGQAILNGARLSIVPGVAGQRVYVFSAFLAITAWVAGPTVYLEEANVNAARVQWVSAAVGNLPLYDGKGAPVTAAGNGLNITSGGNLTVQYAVAYSQF